MQLAMQRARVVQSNLYRIPVCLFSPELHYSKHREVCCRALAQTATFRQQASVRKLSMALIPAPKLRLYIEGPTLPNSWQELMCKHDQAKTM